MIYSVFFKINKIFSVTLIVIFSLSLNAIADELVDSQIRAKYYLPKHYALKQNDIENAAKILRDELAKSDNNDVNKHSFKIFLANGDFEDALKLIEGKEEDLKDDSVYKLLKVAQYIKEKNFAKAKEILPKKTSGKPDLKSTINKILNKYFMAWINVGMGNKDEAIAQLKKEGEESDDSLFLNWQLALIYDFIGKKELASDKYDEVLQQDNIPYYQLEPALNFMADLVKIKKLEQAIKKYNKNTKSLTLLNELGYVSSRTNNITYGFSTILNEATRILFSNNFYKEGLLYLRISQYLAKDNPDITDYNLHLTGFSNQNAMLLSTYYSHFNKQEKAIEILNNISDSSPYRQIKYYMIAKNYSDIDENDLAIDNIRKTLNNGHYTDDVRLKLFLAELYRIKSDNKKAVKIYNDIIENSQNDDWQIYFTRGMSYERMGNWNKAEKDLLKAMQLKPDDANLLNYLGYSWIDRNVNIEKAKDLIQKALELKPKSPQILDSMGWGFYKFEDYEKASYFLEKALEIEPTDAVINDHLGDSYYKEKRYNEAIFQWNRALKYFDNETEISKKDIQQKIDELSSKL